MPEYISCEQCGEPEATCFGGLGTKDSPWQWQCSTCGHVFVSNEFHPEETEE